MQDWQRKLGGVILAGSAVFFFMSMLVAESQYPGYSRTENFISDLGVGSTAGIFNAAMVIVGLGEIAAGLLLFRAFRCGAVIFSGMGAIGVGLFPETAGTVHALSAAAAFIFGGIAAILMSRKLGYPRSYMSMLGMASLAALVLFETGNYLGLGRGGMERMIVYPFLLWGVLFGISVATEKLKERNRASP